MRRFAISCEPEHIYFLEMLELVKKKWKNKNTKVRVTEEFKDFIQSSWHEYVFPDGKGFDWRYFEIYVITAIATALKCSDLWIEGSNEYGSLQEHMMPDEKWNEIKPEFLKELKPIDEILGRKIDWTKIYSALDLMLRLCASIRYGIVRSSLILRKLLSYKDANKILDGFRELGKAARTIYILEYASSKELRRIVQLACNKSEMWHNFQKFVYFGQCGELKTNDLMEQKESATALELVCNIAAYWNARKISEAVEYLKEKGENIKDDDIRFI